MKQKTYTSGKDDFFLIYRSVVVSGLIKEICYS